MLIFSLPATCYLSFLAYFHLLHMLSSSLHVIINLIYLSLHLPQMLTSLKNLLLSSLRVHILTSLKKKKPNKSKQMSALVIELDHVWIPKVHWKIKTGIQSPFNGKIFVSLTFVGECYVCERATRHASKVTYQNERHLQPCN